jgi:RNA polymerase sigma factor (sigma-70 family)
MQHVGLEEAAVASASRAREFLALDEALEELARIDPRKVQVVELRFFGGLSVDETAEALGISSVSVMRDWSSAKAWLSRELTGAGLGS